MSTTRHDVIAEFRRRLEQITVGNGFHTNAGNAVFLQELVLLGDADPGEALLLVVGTDSPTYTGENVATTLPLEVQALVKLTPSVDDPFEKVEQIIEDIRRAIETADRTLAGLVKQRGIERGPTRSIPREEGSAYVGSGALYSCPIVEGWGGDA